MNHTTFTVTRFINRNGTVSWRVCGSLHGVRIRKNFRSREEAGAEKAALELKALQNASGLRASATFLTDDQLREAEVAFRKLAERPRSLMVYLDYALANYREPEREVPLAVAVAEYVATKQKDLERTLLSIRQFRSIKNELDLFKNRFPDALVSEFSPLQLVAYLERGEASLKTYNNRRGILSTFFKFAVQRDWLSTNPIVKAPYHRICHRRGSAQTITAEQAAKLMAHVEEFKGGVLVPYFALCLFAGVRPCPIFGEIAKLRPEHVRLETDTIHIEPEVSKVRMPRRIAIQPNLAEWLRRYPTDRFPIIPKNAVKMRRKVFQAFGLTHDVLRHTFISMFVAKYRSMGEAALQAGNSESIIRKHYLDLKSPTEAEQFFGIMPERAIGVAVPVGTTLGKLSNTDSGTFQRHQIQAA
jgi:integrase